MKPISSLTRRIPANAATAADARARELAASGRDVINFCVGEPDFSAPPEPCEAAIETIRTGNTHYTSPDGTAELKAAVSAALSRRGWPAYAANEIVITAGAKYAVYAAVSVLAEPGDEFLIPSPAWPSYGQIVRLAHAVPVPVLSLAENGFRMTSAALEAMCTARTKAIILNNPCNPTGVLYSEAELCAILEVCARKDLYVICDEVYHSFLYNGAKFTPFASLSADARDRTITIGGLSKTYGMTGWRLGWLCGNAGIMSAAKAFVNHTTGNPSTIAQAAAVAALSLPDDTFEPLRREYESRRNFLLHALRSSGLPCVTPQGAFYVLADVCPRGFSSGEEFARELLEEEAVAVVPGEGYDAAGFVRLAYTLPEDRLREGAARISAFTRRHRR